jgi:flagellar hook assembly protein FlgD
LPPTGIDSISWQLIAADSFNVPLRKAYFNYLLIEEEGSHGMHNPKFAVDVLIQSKNVLIGITTNSNEVPMKYELTQNYPNPFNPVTKFTFSIPKANDVLITIYDITGREITTLVSMKMTPGKYTVDWDGTNTSGNLVSSGVYFYKIVSGDFVETKKMVMVK